MLIEQDHRLLERSRNWQSVLFVIKEKPQHGSRGGAPIATFILPWVESVSQVQDLPSLNRYRQSTDKETKQSIIDIDYTTNEIYETINDPTLGRQLIKLALNHLGEAQVRSIADYVLRRANTPGRAFVSICKKELLKAGIK